MIERVECNEHEEPQVEISDFKIIEAFSVYGGSFVRALALAWNCGDTVHRERIKATWPEYWKAYRRFVKEG